MSNHFSETVSECVNQLNLPLHIQRVEAATKISIAVADTLTRAALIACDLLMDHSGEPITMELIAELKQAILTLGG